SAARPLPVVANLDGDRRSVVVLRGVTKSRGELMMLDAAGQIRERRDLGSLPVNEITSLRTCDVDGDGKDDMLLSHKGLTVQSGSTGHVLWEWRAPGGGRADSFELVEVRRAGVLKEGTLVIRAGGVLEGLAGATGRRLWRRDTVGSDASLLHSVTTNGR